MKSNEFSNEAELKAYLESMGYQPQIMNPADIFADDEIEEEEIEEQDCDCSNGCMECQGMSWRDFM